MQNWESYSRCVGDKGRVNFKEWEGMTLNLFRSLRREIDA